MIKAFYFTALYLIATYCNAQESCKEILSSNIKEGLKNHLLMQYDDIKISEIYSKSSNKKTYLLNALGHSLLKGATDISSNDLYFKELSEKTEAHIGAACLSYQTSAQAKKAITNIEQKGFFENTKILTQYVAINIDSVNLIVYTESSADKTALTFLDSIHNRKLIHENK